MCMQGSATLSMAYAGALFADSCLRGLNGEDGVWDYSYVESDVTDAPFFASKVDLGPDGEGSPCTVWRLSTAIKHELKMIVLQS